MWDTDLYLAYTKFYTRYAWYYRGLIARVYAVRRNNATRVPESVDLSMSLTV